jgi:hypothetical protein
MDERRRDFLAGERPTEVLLYLSDEAVTDPERLAGEGDGERVEDGTVVVVDGERGRRAFAAATGVDAMNFAGRARGRTGEMNRALTGGTCPDDTAERGTADADHRVRFLFAFAEAQQPEGEGLYAEGDVVHAYAQCSCGVAYSDRWVAVDGAD